MRLTVVGCSGSYPGPDSPASCYLLEAEHDDGGGAARTWRILLDLGSGALGALHRYADPLAIDAVFLSHLHADHCLDLCGYYVMRKYHPTGQQPRIPVWGPSGTAARMARAYDLPVDPGMTEEFDFIDHGAPVELGPLRVEAIEVVHPVPAYALKVTAGGRTIVYSGDTGPCPALDDAATDADLLLAEASFRTAAAGANPPDLHMTGADCGRTATKAGVGRLVLTHIPPWHDPAVAEEEARAEWSGPLDLARAGAMYEL
jgi:ribonuclease BN (tRNA processing enzyme)